MPAAEEKLFWSLFNCESEQEVHDLIISNKLLSDENNWFPYGGASKDDRNNFATIENQQAHPIPALIEKITNSIDSLLLRECRSRGINPESPDAPKNMAAAVEIFFGIENGDFSEVASVDRRSIGERIQIIADGDKTTPNITIFDNGEGQHPDDFQKTFLSLLKGNKTRVPFVQGKYNMGSTGALVFCGDYRYQLICSKLAPELNKRADNDFGFTLVRIHPLSESQEEQYKSSWYEYFVLDSKIARFPIKKIDLGLWNRDFESGSAVKLYSYGLPRGSRSSIMWDLWRDLNQYLYHPAMPVLLYEKRFQEKQKSPSKLMLGNKTRLTLDEREKKEKSISFSFDESSIGVVKMDAIVLKPDVDAKEFINKKSVIFTINGQVHGFEGSRFISQELGFPLLKGSLLVHVDCTNIKTSFRQDIFKGSRDRMNEGEKTAQLKDKIIDLLKSNESLKEINQLRKNMILRQDGSDSELLKEVMQKLPVDKELINLLRKNGSLDFLKNLKGENGTPQAPKPTEAPQKTPKASNRFPSIFRLNLPEGKDGRRTKAIPLNGKGIFQFETDVEDEYLFRPKEKGELSLQILGHGKGGGRVHPVIPNKVDDVFEVTISGPTDNSIKITFGPKKDLSIGDEIEVSARLSSPAGDLECIFWVKIVDSKKQEEKPEKPKTPDMPNLPDPIKVFENPGAEGSKSWSDYGWGPNDIVRVIPADDPINGSIPIEAIAINMDSFVLKRFISKIRGATAEQITLIKDKYFLLVYLHSLFLHSIIGNLDSNEEASNEMDTEDKISHIFERYSPFLLALDTNDSVLKSLESD